MTAEVDADYVVVGAGAAGMAFTDALIDHADVRVALVDRRHGPGGHWLDDYAFVRLHQASAFYGVASTLLGDGRLQADGPEAGLHERATGREICAYFEQVLTERLLASGKVSFHPNCDYVGDRAFVAQLTGERYQLPARCRVVDARYLSPDIPAKTPPPFSVGEGADVLPVNDLVRLEAAGGRFVIVGAGKTGTDAIVWLIENGVDPNAICWVRPREPWMLNRAVIQPDPAVFIGMAADTMAAAAAASSVEDLFFRMEDAGVMLRIDRTQTPTMAKTPTLAGWELDRLRRIENVVQLGHLRQADRGRLKFAAGDVTVAPDAVVVHCAASGLKYPPVVPIWGTDAIRLQPVRAGFPLFGAALAGYVEATRDDDAEKNRSCPPSSLPDTPTDWCRMQVLGSRATASFGAEPDIKAWADQVPLNPARTPPEQVARPEVAAAIERLQSEAAAGLARLTEFAGFS